MVKSVGPRRQPTKLGLPRFMQPLFDPGFTMAVINGRVEINAAQPRTTNTARHAVIVAGNMVENKEGTSGGHDALLRVTIIRNVGKA